MDLMSVDAYKYTSFPKSPGFDTAQLAQEVSKTRPTVGLALTSRGIRIKESKIKSLKVKPCIVSLFERHALNKHTT